MQTPQTLFEEILGLLQHPSPCIEEIKNLGESPLLEEHELAFAAYALLAKRANLNPINIPLKPLASGAIPLFSKGFFPWKGLPYPRDHALLGAYLTSLEMQSQVEKMAPFQQAALDHYKKPIHAFFSQESGVSYADLEAASNAFFTALPASIPEETCFFDHELGIAQARTQEKTVLFLGSGCKSGMGVFLYRDAGILNCGPQLLPIGECSGFGLAGRPDNLFLEANLNGFTLSYRTRLASYHPRETGFAGLADSGYSASWIEAKIEAGKDQICCECAIKGFRPIETIAFSFFCKSAACFVAGTHKLNPRSLDRYQGPPQPIELKGKEGSVHLIPDHGFSQMEIIPLAGDDSFWGSDFLIACTLSSPSIRFVFNTG